MTSKIEISQFMTKLKPNNGHETKLDRTLANLKIFLLVTFLYKLLHYLNDF